MTEETPPPALLDINTTPLIDVLLVLLVMLIITIPAQTHTVTLTLPSDQPATIRPVGPVTIAIDATGVMSWNGERVGGIAEIDRRLGNLAAAAPSPEIAVRAHRDAAYRHVVAVISALNRHQIASVTLHDPT
jgi:biopolymer transport protein ExbD